MKKKLLVKIIKLKKKFQCIKNLVSIFTMNLRKKYILFIINKGVTAVKLYFLYKQKSDMDYML